jgi:hypothetical protein
VPAPEPAPEEELPLKNEERAKELRRRVFSKLGALVRADQSV